jgi:hypothetical protein
LDSGKASRNLRRRLGKTLRSTLNQDDLLVYWYKGKATSGSTTTTLQSLLSMLRNSKV